MGLANVESWTNVYTGSNLFFNATGLTALKRYRYKVLARNEETKDSLFSNVAEFYASPLPLQIGFPVTAITTNSKTSMTLTWTQPTIDGTYELPVDSYKIYWNEGYLSSGSFTLLATVNSFDQTFYTIDNLETGVEYKF